MHNQVSAARLMGVLSPPRHKKVEKGSGEVVSALGTTFRWKVKGEETGFAFAVYEMTLEPGRGIPLHMHPFAEFFYVLEGRLDLMGVDEQGVLEWTQIAEGESANAAINAPHGVQNRTDEAARFLSVANFNHEALFNEYETLLEAAGGDGASQKEQMEAFAKVANKYQGPRVAAHGE